MSYQPGQGMVSTLDFISQLQEYETVNTKKNIEYLNVPAAFDIETSSFYDHDQKRAIMYIWMFGIDNIVTYGRTWQEFIALMDALRNVYALGDHRHLIVYVHNLAYEFQFMRKLLPWDNVFLIEDRKPVYALTDGIEFRCSLKLSGGRSLANVANDLQRYPVKKLVGDLDYKKVRSSQTGMTEEELHYCENDIRVLLHYIQEKIEDDGDITKIPLTNTSYVRNYCRNATKQGNQQRKQYRALMNALTVSPDEYTQLKRAFQGGFVHANANYVDKVLENVRSFDLHSSYPAVMVLKKFPMSNAQLIESPFPFNETTIKPYLEKYCCLFDLDLYDVEPRLFQDNPISESKCFELDKKETIVNNGRVVFSKHLKTSCTELDFQTYQTFYEWSRCEITNLRVYKPGYLPKPIVESVLKFYADKTQLKGVPGQELNYMISKNMLNSAYGMMVTAIVRDEITYTSNNTYSKQKPEIDKALNQYNNSLNRFLFYPWGVWVTAHARRCLFRAIESLGNDYVYGDTDSTKFIHPHDHDQFFADYSKEIADLITASSKFFDIPESQYRPKTPKGIPYVIGEWGDEGIYDKFKTLGAKRYLVYKDGDYELTSAGVNKRNACDYLKSQSDPFAAFNSELCVPVEYSGRNILTYIDDPISGTYTDYMGFPFNYTEQSCIHMEGSDYNFSRSDQFTEFLIGIMEVQILGIR